MPDEKQTQKDEQKARQVDRAGDQTSVEELQEQEMEDLEPRSEDTANVTGGRSSLDSGFVRR